MMLRLILSVAVLFILPGYAKCQEEDEGNLFVSEKQVHLSHQNKHPSINKHVRSTNTNIEDMSFTSDTKRNMKDELTTKQNENHEHRRHDSTDTHIKRQLISKRKHSGIRRTIASRKGSIKKKKANSLNGNFTTSKKFKKEEVFVIDPNEMDETETDSDFFNDDEGVSDGNDMPETSFDDDDSVQDVTGDRKGRISHAAEDIIIDEDNTIPGNDVINPTQKQSDSDDDEIISDSLKDGSNTQFLENDQMIKANEVKGNYFPVYRKKPSLETVQLSKTIQSRLAPSVELHAQKVNFFKDKSSTTQDDPAIRKALASDFAIDKSISNAIKEQIDADIGMTASTANAQVKPFLTEGVENSTAVGDFANIVEQTKKLPNDENENTIKPNSIFSPVTSDNKPETKLLENIAEKIHPASANFENFDQPLLKQERKDQSLDIYPRLSSLSSSEKQLISYIDNAFRARDVGAEVATKIMMPSKEDTVSDRTVAPSEQLLDMLAKGRFKKPLSDDILNKLSTFDPNRLYMQEEGFSNLNPSLFSNSFAKVGQDYVPVRNVAVNMPKPQANPLINKLQIQKAQDLMKSDPAYLAQNLQLLDPNKFQTFQDLGNIGETILPGHVLHYKPKPVPQTPQPPPPPPPAIHHRIMQPKIYPHDLPERIAKLLADHRAKQKAGPQNFEDALSDAPSHNTVDRFIPERKIVLADETKTVPECKWNPCENGGLCTAHPDKPYCSCKPGWFGDTCNKRSPCFPNPCNHGICWPNAEGYTCTCKTGYKGSKCDLIDRCHPNPCFNNGICTETADSVQCECAVGFKGPLCALESKCEPVNPCLNGATCVEYTDHYYCVCSNGFRGQNCQAFIAPTKPPPTIPIKHEGPQAIPPPDNIPTSIMHEIFAEKYTDSSGKVVTNSRESYAPANDGTGNSAAGMVPHPVAITSPISESHNPLSDSSHGVFGEPTHGNNVGAPGTADKFIIHSSDEKGEKSFSENSHKNNSSDSITGEDDRYQTHLVQVGDQKEDHHLSVHVGQSIPETSEPISPATNPHPSEADGERANQINSDNKLSVQDAHENHMAHLKEQTVQEVYVDPLHTPKDELHLSEAHGYVNSDSTQDVIVNSANTRSSFPHNIVTPSERSTLPKTVKSELNKTNTDSSSNPYTKTRSSKQNIQKLTHKVSEAGHQTSLKVSKETKAEHDKANQVLAKINKQIQNDTIAINQINPNFMKQKDAYSAWRRKALINFRKRYPTKPLPKNTLSLSKNSLCPNFCKLYCDPWCVKIGCCKTTKNQQELYKKIEMQHKPQIMIIESHACDNCNENADCADKRCQCKTGFHGDGVACTIDNCLLCHLDADCVNERCVCKEGFFGDGYECKEEKLQHSLCSKCHRQADCIGGDCLCSRGFYGNGKSCWPLPITKRHL